MAAPPIPPKGSSSTWVNDSKVTDPLSWKPQNPAENSQMNYGFMDNFMNLGSSTQTAAPPLPPRRPCSTTQSAGSSFEISELNLVPPPPGAGQLFKNNAETQNFSSSFCSSSNNFNKPGFSTVVQNSLFQSSTTSVSGISNVSSRNHFANSPVISSSSTSVPSGVQQPLGFANCMYQSNFLNSSYTLQQYTRSTISGFSAGSSCTFNKQSYSVKNENFRVPSTVTYSAINLNHPPSNNNNQTNLENILKFMKKRSDSNLIDLYSGEDEILRNTNTNHDDILRLFDPLTKDTEKSSVVYTQPEVKSKDYVDNIPNVGLMASKTSIENKTENEVENSKTIPKEIISDSPTSPPMQCNGKTNSDAVLKIFYKNDNYSGELDFFCSKLKNLRSGFSFDDHVTNAGLVISPTLDNHQEDSLSIKLIINSVNSERPVSFTCDVSTTVEHIISHSVCTIFDDTSSISMDNFVLKVHGLSEYFSKDSSLADYEYVHQCHKFDKPVCLTLTDIKDLNRSLARTKKDDVNDTSFKCKDIAPSSNNDIISFDSLNILLDTLEREIEK